MSAVTGTVDNPRTTNVTYVEVDENGVEIGEETAVEVEDGAYEVDLPKGRYLFVETPPTGKRRLFTVEVDPDVGNDLELAYKRTGAGSFQPLAADLELGEDAGTSEPGETDFLAGVMGHVLGAELTKLHNYIAGVIGAYSVSGDIATLLPAAGLLGIIMDGGKADGIVTALIDGSDPASTTHAVAAFAARQLNTDEDSGVDYGLDLHHLGADIFSDDPLPLKIHKAALRLTGEICVMSGAGAPVDGTTGDNFAGKGSLYINETNGDYFRNTGTKANPAWTALA